MSDMFPILIVIVPVVMFLASAIRILNEYQRAVIFRLGRIIATKGPGLIILIPIVDKMVRIDMRTITMDIPPQDVITRDNVSIKVNAVVYFRVIDAKSAVIDVENYLYATLQLSQTSGASAARWNWTKFSPSVRRSTSSSRRSWTGAPNLGESRFLTSRSSRSICLRR
jgi:regulator of protease activity HflC (stomatin/prohibitin superfamily)